MDNNNNPIILGITTNNGYRRSDHFPSNTVPGVIAGRVFSISDSKLNEFYQVLNEIYSNPLVAPILNVIAAYIYTKDDLMISYGFEAEAHTNGHYQSNNSILAAHLSTLSPLEQQVIMAIYSFQGVLGKGSYAADLKQIHFRADLRAQDFNALKKTIVHEFSHMAAELIFKNYSLGFDNNIEQEKMFEDVQKQFAKSLLLLLSPQQHDSFDSLDSFTYYKAIESIFINKGRKSNVDNESVNDIEKGFEASGLKSLMESFVISSSYGGKHAVVCEQVARLMEFLVELDKYPTLQGLFKPFIPYFDGVLNNALKAFFESDNKFLTDFPDVETQIDFHPVDFPPLERMYFAIIQNDIDCVSKLIAEGVDVNGMCFGITRPISVAMLCKNNEMMKLLLATQQIDINYKDALFYSLSAKECMDKQSEEVKALLVLEPEHQDLPQVALDHVYAIELVQDYAVHNACFDC